MCLVIGPSEWIITGCILEFTETLPFVSTRWLLKCMSMEIKMQRQHLANALLIISWNHTQLQIMKRILKLSVLIPNIIFYIQTWLKTFYSRLLLNIIFSFYFFFLFLGKAVWLFCVLHYLLSSLPCCSNSKATALLWDPWGPRRGKPWPWLGPLHYQTCTAPWGRPKDKWPDHWLSGEA